MAASDAALANLALANLGVAGAISVLSSDTTTEGKSCRTFLPIAKRETLAGHEWQSQTEQVTLTLVETFAASATREWLYRYRLPESCVRPIRLLWGGVRNPRQDQQVPFRLYRDEDSAAWAIGTTYDTGEYASVTTSGATIWYRALRETVGDAPASSASDWVAITGGPPDFLHTDLVDAILECVVDAGDVVRYEPLLEQAVAARLAWYVAPAIGASAATRQEALQTWLTCLAQAQASDYMARQRDLPPDSGWAGARFVSRR